MWEENYVASVKNIRVKIDNYMINDLTPSDNEDYEFLFKYNTYFKHIEKYNTKKMLVSAYNVGKIINEKFTYDDIIDINSKTVVKRNIFLKASYEANLAYQGQPKRVYKEIIEEIEKEKQKGNNEIDKKLLEKKLRRRIEKEVYKKHLEWLFKMNNINEKDYKNLIKAIKKFVEACGVPNVKDGINAQEQNLFSVILISDKIYKFIKSGGKYTLESKQTQTMTKEGICKFEFDTVNDLLYSLAINYFAFKSQGYIICDVCHKMAEGNAKKKTCSETCKKIRNGSYNKKK